MIDFNTVLLFFWVFVFGLIIGSFLNCLIWRLYKEETILGRSRCPLCSRKIEWYDNIPILSFFILRRRCRFCKNKISWQYPAVELISGLLFLLSFYLNFNNDFSAVKVFSDFVLISLLIIIFIFDWRWFLIPVQILIFGGLFFLGVNLYLGISVWQLFLSMIFGAGFFALQYFITKRKGVGEGDIWLGGFLGLSFPIFGDLILLVFSAYIIGGVSAILLLIFGLKKIGAKLPLGIFLSVAAVITLFWSNNLINWYLKLVL